jgi:hypothetical protein
VRKLDRRFAPEGDIDPRPEVLAGILAAATADALVDPYLDALVRLGGELEVEPTLYVEHMVMGGADVRVLVTYYDADREKAFATFANLGLCLYSVTVRRVLTAGRVLGWKVNEQ